MLCLNSKICFFALDGIEMVLRFHVTIDTGVYADTYKNVKAGTSLSRAA